MVTSFPFKELYNYSVILAAGTLSATDVIEANINDYEAINKVDMLELKIGEYTKAIYLLAAS